MSAWELHDAEGEGAAHPANHHRPAWRRQGHALLLAVVLLGVGCHKDRSLKAAKSECDQACAHAWETNPKIGVAECSSVCIGREWTVGDTTCIQDARMWDGVKDCAVIAKTLLDEGAQAEERAADVAAKAQAQAEEESKKFQAAIAEQQKKTESLLSQLSSAKDDATRLALQKQLDEERAKTEAIKKGTMR